MGIFHAAVTAEAGTDQTDMKKKIAVIGSGFGGLAAAIRLAARGHEVDIYEKLDKPGGRAYVFELDGFSFDAGPTVITAPFLFDEIFEAAGKRREEYISFIPLDPFYRIFNHEGRHFDYNGNMDFVLSEIDRWNPADKDGYRKFIGTTKAIFQKGFVELADKPFLKFSDMLRIAPDLIRLQSYRTVYSYVSQYIRDDFLRRVFSFHPLLVGGNPFDTTSIYALIHYLEREWGVHYAAGGTGALVRALTRLFKESGGRLHLHAEVCEILVQENRVTGLRLKHGETVNADAVVSNADVTNTYRTLIPSRHRKKNTNRHLERMHHSMSLFVVYFGTRRRYTDCGLAHHNIILSNRYRDLLSDIFRGNTLPEDFSLYLHLPTLTDSSIAPEGCELFYVLAPVPHLGANIDWTVSAKEYKNRILDFLEARYLPGLRKHIITEHFIDPLYFQNHLNTYLGSGFSIEPRLTQSAWFRPHNRSEDFDNLYIAGAGTHPGAGLPGVLSSAKIIDALIAQDEQG